MTGAPQNGRHSALSALHSRAELSMIAAPIISRFADQLIQCCGAGCPLTSFGQYARAKANNIAVAPMTNIMFAVAPIAKA